MKQKSIKYSGVMLCVLFILLYACKVEEEECTATVCGTFPTEMQGEWGAFESRGSAFPTTKSGNKEMEIDSTGIYLRGGGNAASTASGFPSFGAYINAGVDSTGKTQGNVLTARPSADILTNRVSAANTTFGDWTGTLKMGFVPSSDVRYGIEGDRNNLRVMILAGYVDTYDASENFVETISVGQAFWQFTLLNETTNAYEYNITLGSVTTAGAGYIGNRYQIVKWK